MREEITDMVHILNLGWGGGGRGERTAYTRFCSSDFRRDNAEFNEFMPFLSTFVEIFHNKKYFVLQVSLFSGTLTLFGPLYGSIPFRL